MNKKSQSAMEYLMTYGWAILVVLIALGALFYLGVFNPKTPATCSISSPLNCADTKITAVSGLELSIGATGANSVAYTVGSAIKINGVNCVMTDDGDAAPNQANGIMENVKTQRVIVKCNPGLTAGTKYTGTIDLTYTLIGSTITHITQGQFSGTVE